MVQKVKCEKFIRFAWKIRKEQPAPSSPPSEGLGGGFLPSLGGVRGGLTPEPLCAVFALV